ncbi:FadR/GntR family transcriptional regulator [Amycolatopsis sp. GM8]|uniref:FadR/GntR family transcriptional regulator n=1 Tax=Amycolatopsis sp. GM8 TaxID=2896530 RepID=UPI001F43F9A8|nr:FCD domain-containing protein [Amycolatopsis sp. GM8]
MKTAEGGSGSRRRYLDIAQNLLTAFNNGEYSPGDRLPAHSEIATQANVSRATAREAFLALELIGAIEVRHGDGTFLRGSAAKVGGAHSSPLDVPPRELIECRLHIEPIVAGLAAARIPDEQFAVLEGILDEQQDLVDKGEKVARFVALGLDFHTTLAPGCGNSQLADIVRQLVNFEHHPLWALVNQQGMPDARSRQSQVDEHRAVFDGLRSRHPETASGAMSRHLGHLERTLFPSAENARSAE